VNADNNRFLVFRQGAGGSLTRVVIPVSTEVLDSALGVVDIDGDGDMDFISGATLDFDQSLYYLENKSLSFTTRHPIAGLMDVYSLETGDLDGDGDEDLVFIDRLSGYRVGYFVNQGLDNWSDPVILGYYSSFGAFAYQNLNLFDTWLHLKDMDSDGKKDIVVSAIPNDQVFWFKNQTLFTGTESLKDSPTLFYPQPAAEYVRVENLPFDNGVLTIYDSYGRQVMNRIIQNDDVIDLVNMSSGLFYYLVSSQDGHQLLSGKLMNVKP